MIGIIETVTLTTGTVTLTTGTVTFTTGTVTFGVRGVGGVTSGKKSGLNAIGRYYGSM